jgi:prolyl-tRNA editing enzyme YbaK/EbsC (Cys-tRNA(Pro) deacylase)
MSEYREKLKRYSNEHGVVGGCLIYSESCHTALEAANAVGAEVSDIVKNICCIADEEKLITVILSGGDRLSLTKVQAFLGASSLRMASKEEVLLRTGYPCGGVPSFGYGAIFIVDERVFECAHVYTGGGDEYSLFKITPQELLKANGGKVVDVKK